MKFALATANPGKIKEMGKTLAELGFELITREELGICLDIEEPGETFYENALIKSKTICKASSLPAIADDSGLCVGSLNGDPGVYSSTYGGAHLDDDGRCKYLLKRMKNMELRSAIFVCNIVCVFPDGIILGAEGKCTGVIATEQRGSGGFGYDSVFIPEGFSRTAAEMSMEEKNQISHRGKALRAFAELLRAQILTP